MSLQHRAVDGSVHLAIDVIGGNYRIATQSLNEVLVDARATHNKKLIPELVIEGNVAKLVKHQLLPWFQTSKGVDAVVLVPEGSSITLKMYNGKVTVAGSFETVNLNVRHGEVSLGPGFALEKNGLVKIISGDLLCRGLSDEGFSMPWHSNKITRLDHENGVSLRVELRLGELVFS